MSFNIGNAIKYLWRADEKGAAIEDLKKAAWYIADEIQKRETVAATYRQNPYGFLLVERCVVGTCTPDVTTGEIAPCTKCGHPYRRNDTGTAWIDAAS